MPKSTKPTSKIKDTLRIAVPKGRILEPLAKRLQPMGVDPDTLLGQSRKLVRVDKRTGWSFLLLKPDDVPTYVEHGAADVGIVGRDVLLEGDYDIYCPVDLGIGRCRMIVAGVTWPEKLQRPLRVATKFPNVAMRFFLNRGVQAEMISVRGSVELAPLVGLADVIVDLVETGETLRQNGLQELATIATISSLVTVNRISLKLKRAIIHPLLSELGS